jgi:hypothetical protein
MAIFLGAHVPKQVILAIQTMAARRNIRQMPGI